MELSASFPCIGIEEFIRRSAAKTLQPQPPIPSVLDEETTLERLDALDYDAVDWDVARLPTQPPDSEQWKNHLDQLTLNAERRTFKRDSQDLVQALPLWNEPQCANGKKCVGTTFWRDIAGLTEAIVLKPISPDPEGCCVHEPMCVLCHRARIYHLLHKDKYRTTFLNKASDLSCPGPVSHQHKAKVQLQTFWNPRDCHDGYASSYMREGRDGDHFVLPVARLCLDVLRAERVVECHDGVSPTMYRWQIIQDALQFVVPSNAVVHPPVVGETVAHMLDRNQKLMSVASRTAHHEERRKFVLDFLLPYHRWVTRDVPFLWRLSPVAVHLPTLDRLFYAPPAAFDAELRMVLCHLTDASLSIHREARAACPWASYATLSWDTVCFDRILDPALHGYVEQAGYFGPLSSVRSSITRQLTKNGVNQRCQQRNSKGMAIKKIVTREIEKMRQRGHGNKVIGVNRYHGYVLRTCKQWMLCSLLGNYVFVGHEHRPLEHDVRRRLYQIFTEPMYERWVVKLIHQCTHMLTASVREFMCYSIGINPPLHACVHELMQLDAYRDITEAALNEARAYFRRYLLVQTPWHTYGQATMKDQSDLYYSLLKLPTDPASLQHYYVCGSPRCSLPCPHKFMRTKEAKKAMAPTPQGGDDPFALQTLMDELAEDVERELVQTMSKDWDTVIVQHRQEEVERERHDTENERKSGWRWKTNRFHKHLKTVFDEMDVRASEMSYSRPWKLVVLFRPTRKRKLAHTATPTTDLIPAQHRRLLNTIVQRSGPVKCGDAMSRIISFFPSLGVDEETTGVLLDLMARFHDTNTTENKLQEIMALFAEHRPYAHALMQHAWSDLKAANDQYFTVLLPSHIAFYQLQEMQAVYGAILSQTACFVFCPGCDHIYSHLMDANTMYAKVFRFGLRDAQTDPHTGKRTCKRYLTKQKTICRHELVQVPLIGRALFFKNKVVMLCAQPRCARLMVLDNYDRHYTAWTDHGPACSMCMPLMLHTVNLLRKMDAVYLNKSNEQGYCCLHEAHEEHKRASTTQLIVLMHGVVVCKKHYVPEMGERALALWTTSYGKQPLVDVQESVRDIAHEVYAKQQEERQRKRHHQLAERASNGGRRRPSKRQRSH